MLKLVCDCSSISGVTNSNHTLHYLGMEIIARDRELVDQAVGVDDANLLRVSLEANRSSDKLMVARHKILWCHATSNLNVGDSSIPTGALPLIFAWFGGDFNWQLDGVVHDHALLNACTLAMLPQPYRRLNSYNALVFDMQDNIDATGLNSIYCIVRTRPDIFTNNNLKRHRGKLMGDSNGRDEMELISVICVTLGWVFGIVLLAFYLGNSTGHGLIDLLLVTTSFSWYILATVRMIT